MNYIKTYITRSQKLKQKQKKSDNTNGRLRVAATRVVAATIELKWRGAVVADVAL